MIYEHNSYRKIVREQLLRTKTSYDTLCTNIQVAKPYLSRVLNEKANLSDEQLFKTCKFFNFNKDETEFIINLLLLEKSENPHYKKYLSTKIEKIKEEKLSLKNRLSSTPAHSGNFSDDNLFHYYTNPKTQILHMLLGVPHVSKDKQNLSKVLSVNIQELSQMLGVLEALGLIKWESDVITLLKNTLHLDENHPLSTQNHLVWRLHVLPNNISNKKNNYRFTATVLADEKHLQILKQKIKDLVVDYSKLLTTSKDEKVFQFNIDIIDLF